MGVIKKLRSKLRRERDGKVPLEIKQQEPERVFLWRFFNIAFCRDRFVVSIPCYRRVFPQEPLGSALSRVWLRGPVHPDDVVQIRPEVSPNFGGCCMLVTDCGDNNVFGYILAPSRDGRVGISMCLPFSDVRKVGRARWRSSKLFLHGAER